SSWWFARRPSCKRITVGTPESAWFSSPHSRLHCLADGEKLRAAGGAQLLNTLGRVLEDALAGLHAEVLLLGQLPDVGGHVGAVLEIGIEVARHRLVDVEPGNVEELHRTD